MGRCGYPRRWRCAAGGSAGRPEIPWAQRPGCGAGAAHDRLRRGPQRRRGVEEMARQALKQVRIVRSIPRWCSCTCAFVQASVAARSKALMSFVLSMRSRTPSRDSATMVQNAMRTVAPGARRTRRRRAKTGSRTAPVDPDSSRPSITAAGVANAPSAAEEAAPVGFELRLSTPSPSSHRMMRGPNFRLVRRAAPPRRQDGARARDIFGLDEQFREGGMGGVGRLAAQ